MDPKMWCVRGARSAALGTVVVLTTLGAHAGVASASAGHVAAPAVAAATTATTCKPAVNFNRINFSHPTKIDNLWLPLTPGTQFVLTGQADRGTGTLPHDVIFTVTDLTKVIDGVRTRVIWDRDLNDGELTEAELAFFAQDNAGNVWSMGE